MEELVFMIQTILLAMLVAWLVWEYSDKHVPLYVKALTFFSWIFTFSAFIILPIDIANSYREENKVDMENTRSNLYILWKILYWLNFLQSFIILPLCQDYEDSGEFTPKDKVKSALKKNLVIYLVGLVIGILLICYLYLMKNLEMKAIEGVLAGLGNLVGILLIIMLLGYGFVAIPRTYIQECNQEKELQSCYQSAVEVDEYKMEKLYDLEEKCRVLYALQKEYGSSDLATYLGIILSHIPQDLQATIKSSLSSQEQIRLMEAYQPLNMENVAALNRQVKKLLFDLRRAETKFKILSERSWKLELIIQADGTFSETGGSWITRSYAKLVYLYTFKLHKNLMKSFGYLFVVMSVILLFGELSIFAKIPINLLKLTLKLDTGFYLTQVILFPFLIYIACCTYYGLFHLNLAGLFSFNRHHQTDPPSLMFGSINFGRVSFPLCYNFIQLTQTSFPTAFSEILGDMNVIPIFGPAFSTLLPVMLILMCFFNLFKMGTKIMGAIGLSGYASKDQRDGLSEDGKRIIIRERENRLQDREPKTADRSPQSSQQELSTQFKKEKPRLDSSKNRYIKNFNDILNI